MPNVQEYAFLLFISFIVPVLVIQLIFKRRSVSRYPPSPRSFPLIGHLHLLAPLPHQAFHNLCKKYGPIISIKLGSIPCVEVSSPETAKEFLKTHETYFSNRPHSIATDYMTYGSQDFSFAPYGPYWKFMKKICMSELLGGRTLGLLLPVRHDEIKNLIDFLLKKAEANEAVDLGEVLIKMSIDVISRMLMGKRCSENEDDARDVRKFVKETLALIGKFNLSDFIWLFKNFDLQGFRKRLQGVHERIDKVMEVIIEEHQEERRKLKELKVQSQEAKDLLDILLGISEDENSDIRLTRENIKAFILNMFFGGTETSAATVEWAVAELINHPSIMHKAQQEIDEIVGKERLVTESDIPNLPYLQAIVKETLRLHPGAPLAVRESTEACNVAGYDIPAKARVFVNLWSIGRDPNYWENPLEFVPERFVKNQMDLRGQHYQLIPFGSGRRGCPGISLALQIVQTSLAALIQCFEWKIKDGSGEVDMEEAPGFSLPRAHPLVCLPIPRLNTIPLSSI